MVDFAPRSAGASARGPGRSGAARVALLVVLALAAAVAEAPLGAQQVPADTTRRPARDTASVAIPPQTDTLVRSPADPPPDSAAKVAAAPDTIQPPLARAEQPLLVEPEGRQRWDRDALFATGAITLLDLLERIPGVTPFRAGWLGAPATASYLGVPARVRLFYDGVELDPLEQRFAPAHDLGAVLIWTLEELAIERTAGELRVYMRSWRHERTTPVTRVDVMTGDENTNAYRGYYGRRFGNGASLQLAAQQFSTGRGRFGGDADALDLVARAGWARAGLSVDGYMDRSRRRREAILRSNFPGFADGAPIAPHDARRTTAYLRAAVGDPDRGAWAQAIAASLAVDETSPRGTVAGLAADSADTTRSRGQYVLAGGISGARLRLSGTGRARVYDGRTRLALLARAAYGGGPLAVTLTAEDDAALGRRQADAIVRLTPLPFLMLGAAATVGAGTGSAARRDSTGPAFAALRGEAAIRLGGLWLGGGVLARDTATLAPLTVFDTAVVGAAIGRAVGTFATVRGRLYGPLRADIWGIVWNGADTLYRPRFQTRSELLLDWNLAERFPRGRLAVRVAAVHEYRSRVLFPTSTGVAASTHGRVFSTLLEIRLLDAYITYQFRNVARAIYGEVPGFQLSRGVQVYGVRWEFWN